MDRVFKSKCDARNRQAKHCNISNYWIQFIDFFVEVGWQIPDDCHGTCDPFTLNHWHCD